ncbi:hypothetical protein DFJ77DRAFT_448172 [Powellomyces hirtus]|nr:hypothetical protein DFJ77DRAFT_448172 [Powellomyces hirtus]
MSSNLKPLYIPIRPRPHRWLRPPPPPPACIPSLPPSIWSLILSHFHPTCLILILRRVSREFDALTTQLLPGLLSACGVECRMVVDVKTHRWDSVGVLKWAVRGVQGGQVVFANAHGGWRGEAEEVRLAWVRHSLWDGITFAGTDEDVYDKTVIYLTPQATHPPSPQTGTDTVTDLTAPTLHPDSPTTTTTAHVVRHAEWTVHFSVRNRSDGSESRSRTPPQRQFHIAHISIPLPALTRFSRPRTLITRYSTPLTTTLSDRPSVRVASRRPKPPLGPKTENRKTRREKQPASAKKSTNQKTAE